MNTKTKRDGSVVVEIPADLPNLDNATPGSLVDELGGLRENIKKMQKFEGYYKEALKARLDEGQATVDGEVFSALVENLTRSGLSTTKIREDMSAQWVEEYTTTTDYVQIKTTRR